MKRKPIPQYEFGFSADAFNLAGQQSTPAAQGVAILAEMTPEERERVREAHTRAGSEACQEEIEITREIEAKREADQKRSARIADNRRAMGGEYLDDEPATLPGLRPGSSWSVAEAGMVKALATMQGGSR